jgi:hypothetical protein
MVATLILCCFYKVLSKHYWKQIFKENKCDFAKYFTTLCKSMSLVFASPLLVGFAHKED